MAADRSPLLASQLGVWFAQRISPDSPSYCVAQYIDICGSLDGEVLRAAVRQVIEEGESLRVAIRVDFEVPRQVVCAFPGEDVEFLDFSLEKDPEASAMAWMQDRQQETFDLETGPLFRFTLLALSGRRHCLHMRAHHLVLDGFSFGLLVARLGAVYSALAKQRPLPGGAFPPFNLLVEEEAAYLMSEESVRQRRYWYRQLVGWPEPRSLAFGAPAGQVLGGPVLRARTQLSDLHVDRLRRLAAELRLPWTVVLVAAGAAFHARRTGERDVVVGMPVPGRPTGRLRRIPGMLANVLPLRLSVQPESRVEDYIRQTGSVVQEALRNQRHRAEELHRELTASGSGRLFSTQVNVMSYEHLVTFGDSTGEVVNLSTGPADDLLLSFHGQSALTRLLLDVDANSLRYDRQAVLEIQHHFVEFLADFIRRSDALLGQLVQLTAAELKSALVRAGHVATPAETSTSPCTLVEWF
ncbi:condensation domain-containing protein, partial [Streptomyces rhizosphaericus]